MSKLRGSELGAIALLLGTFLSLLFFPVVLGNKTLLSGSLGTASIMPSGAYMQQPLSWSYPQRGMDPGGVAWFAEAYYALTHLEIFKDHLVPLWNPYNGCGVPLLANMQSQVLNPLQFMAWLNPSPHAVDLYVLFRLLAAGVLTYAFLRTHTLRLAALGGAMAYMLSGYLIVYLGMPDISVCVMIPGLFWAIEQVLSSPDARAGASLAAFTALTLLGGMPEVSFLALFFGAAYFLLRVFTKPLDSWRRRSLSVCAFGLLLGSMLAAPMVLPFLEYVVNSFNAHDWPGYVVPGSKTTAHFLLHALNYLAPLSYGPLGRCGLASDGSFGLTGYWGASVTFLALCALVASLGRISRSTGKKVDLLTAFSAAVWLLLLAKKFGCPLVQWLGLLPVFRLVVFWKYGEPLVGFFVAVLAGLGIHALQERALAPRRLLWLFVAMVASVAGLAVRDAAHGQSLRFYTTIILWSLLAASAVFAASLIIARKPRLFKRFAPIAVAVVALELSFNFIVPTFYKFSPFPPFAANPYDGAPFIRFLQAASCNQERLIAYDAVLPPDWSSAFELQDVRDQDAMYPARLLSFMQAFAYGLPLPVLPLADHNLTTRFDGEESALDPLRSGRLMQIQRLWQLTSTRYVLGMVAHTVPPAGKGTDKSGTCHSGGDSEQWLPMRLAPVYAKEVTILRVPSVLPRAALYYNVESVAAPEHALSRLLDPSVNVFHTAIVERTARARSSSPSIVPVPDADVLCDAAEITGYGPDDVEIIARPTRNALLVLNDTYFPGWRCFVDGRATEIVRANYLFRGVFLEVGEHRVRFTYRPDSFSFGLVCAAAAAILIVGWLCIRGK